MEGAGDSGGRVTNMNHPEFLKALQKRHFFITKKKEDTKNTKLDVDDASLCVSLCFLCENHVAWGLFLKIRDDELMFVSLSKSGKPHIPTKQPLR